MISFSAELNGVHTVYIKPSIQAYKTGEEGSRAVSHHVINRRNFSSGVVSEVLCLNH